MPGFILVVERTSFSKLGRIRANALKTASESKAARAAAFNAGRVMLRRFQRTTKTWVHPVEFKLSVTGKIGSNIVAYEINTTDEIWHWLDKGTRWKKVRADPDEGYVPKTQPTVFGSFAGGGKMVPSEHPTDGITARRWSSDPRTHTIAKLLLKDELRKQMRKVARDLSGGN